VRPAAKAGLVALGYVAAVAVAWLVVRIYMAATSDIDRQTYGGMSAFGDSLVFLAAFGLAAVPATGAGLYFLRPRRAFWVTLSVASLAVAFTSLAALLAYIAPVPASGSVLRSWAQFFPLRILAAPLFALFFLLCGLFAPTRSARVSLYVAGAIETVVFVSVAFTWFYALHR
jgi:hypothetical protein